ncbi:MAG: PEF-CTERM sorting domain-containing protein [Methanophagales archaeon]|nr:PEF-CTERM sorting domain-containing protein [Methanophagales archaeon]
MKSKKIGTVLLAAIMVSFFVVMPASAQSLGEAVDNTALTWTTGGHANWFGQTTTSYYGGDAAQSGDIYNHEQSWIQTTVTGPGTLTFYWKVSSEDWYDYLIYIDGTEQDSICGEVDWHQMRYNVGSGSHTLRWTFDKDVSISDGYDCGWLDKVEFTPDTQPIPEFSTIALPVASILGLLFFFNYRKRRKE